MYWTTSNLKGALIIVKLQKLGEVLRHHDIFVTKVRCVSQFSVAHSFGERMLTRKNDLL